MAFPEISFDKMYNERTAVSNLMILTFYINIQLWNESVSNLKRRIENTSPINTNDRGNIHMTQPTSQWGNDYLHLLHEETFYQRHHHYLIHK